MLNEIIAPWRQASKPLDRRTIPEWARENIKIGAWSPWEGDFSTERSPQIVEPLTTLGKTGPRRLTILGPAAGSKSTIAEVFLSWLIDNAPGFTVWYAQDEEAAKEFAETRVNRFLDSCERVRRWFPENRHQKRTQALHMPHMSFVIQAANTGNVQSKHIRHMICDETHMWEPGMLAASHKRTTRFNHNKTIIELSTGSCDGDETDRAWNQGSKQRWQVFCPTCKQHHVPQWTFGKNEAGGVKWSQEARIKGGWDFRKVAQSTVYECPKCKAQYAATSANGYMLNRDGKYSEHSVDGMPNHFSYHWNCICTDFSQLGEIAVEFLLAKAAVKRGEMSLLKEFTQKKLAEAWQDQLPEVETVELAGDYSMGDPWDEEFRRFVTIDVQLTHFWVVVRAWSKRPSSRLVWAGRCETWGEIDDVVAKHGVSSEYVAADAGHFTDAVYTECAFRGWKVIKGEDTALGYRKTKPDGRAVYEAAMFSGGDERRLRNKMYPQQLKPGSKARFCELILVSNPRTSESLHLFRTGRAEGWTTAKDTPDDHKNQMASVVRRYVEVGKTGQKVPKWFVVGKHGDHLWDCERYQIALAVLSGLLKEKLPTETESDKSEENSKHA